MSSQKTFTLLDNNMLAKFQSFGDWMVESILSYVNWNWWFPTIICNTNDSFHFIDGAYTGYSNLEKSFDF